MEDQKKTWNTPVLTAFGSVEKLTLLKAKSFGATDGNTFNGIAISG